jgi:hypothetical protein
VASAKKAQELLETMQKIYQEGNPTAKPDTITVSPHFLTLSVGVGAPFSNPSHHISLFV